MYSKHKSWDILNERRRRRRRRRRRTLKHETEVEKNRERKEEEVGGGESTSVGYGRRSGGTRERPGSERGREKRSRGKMVVIQLSGERTSSLGRGLRKVYTIQHF